MSLRTEVLLFHRLRKEYVTATLIDGVSRQELESAEQAWKPVIKEALLRIKSQGQPRPQHGHWNWLKKYDVVANYLSYQILGIECAGAMQGLMLIQNAATFSRIPSQGGKGLVYIHFLETAPWNISSLVPEPHYRHAGTALVSAAIDISKECGFKGRLSLHSLPQAESWYSGSCKMTDMGLDPKKSNLRYFEMTPEQATDFQS